MYNEKIHIQDVEDVIRGQLFPVILWKQVDGIFEENDMLPPTPKKRYVNVKEEMIRFFDIAYNDKLNIEIKSVIEKGFNNSKLTVSEARDILIGWDKLDNFPNASVNDLFLKGGIENENDFIMFVRGY